MRICLAAFHLEHGIAGETAAIFNLRNGLAERGLDITLLTPRVKKVDTAARPISHNEAVWFKVFNLMQGIRKLNTLSEQMDIVHLQLPTPAFSCMADMVKTGKRSKKVVVFEGHLNDISWAKLVSQLPHAFRFYLVRALFNGKTIARLSRFKADQYVVSSAYQKRELLSLGVTQERIEVIPTMVKESTASCSRQEARQALRLGEEPLITYIGHFFHAKGVETLIDAFPGILKRHPHARLILAWSGLGPRERIERHLKKKNILKESMIMGTVDVFRLMAASDVLVLPYAFSFGTICYPSIIIEAFSSGIPLVTSDIGPLKELCDDNRALLVCPNDPEAVTKTVLTLFSDKNLCETMRKKQRDFFSSQLAPHLVLDRYLRLYEKLMDTTPSQ